MSKKSQEIPGLRELTEEYNKMTKMRREIEVTQTRIGNAAFSGPLREPICRPSLSYWLRAIKACGDTLRNYKIQGEKGIHVEIKKDSLLSEFRNTRIIVGAIYSRCCQINMDRGWGMMAR